MKLSHKVLAEGRVVPWYLGLGYQSITTEYEHFYPIPFHLMVRLWHQVIMRFAYWVKFPPKDRWETQLEEKYWTGYNDGAKVRDEHLDALADLLGRLKKA